MSMKRKSFVGTLAVAATQTASVSAKNGQNSSVLWDFIIIGSGTAGLPAAIFASRRGAKVLLIDSAEALGGTLNLANGQVAAAGTRTQIAKGIMDTPDAHYEDIMRITDGVVDPNIIRKTVDNAPDTINWLLDNGLKPLPDHPVTGSDPGRPTYRTARYIWGKGQGRDILAVVLKQLAPELESGRVVTQLETDAKELLVSDDGSVKGVRAQGPSGE